MDKTLFELVPVSVKPEEDGWYFVIEPNHETGKNYCEWDSLYNGWYDEAANRREPTYYLLPFPPPVAEERTFTLAEAEEIFEASREKHQPYGKGSTKLYKYSDLEQYLASISSHPSTPNT